MKAYRRRAHDGPRADVVPMGACKVPRVVRAKGYRSKAAAGDGVSSATFSNRDLRASVGDTVIEYRGNTGNGAPAPVGSIGLALALRARVVRGL